MGEFSIRPVVVFVIFICCAKPGEAQQRPPKNEIFLSELFLNDNDINSGLYEGSVIGRRRFGDTQVPHGLGTINYFTNDKFGRRNYTGYWKNGNRDGNGTTFFKDASIYRGDYRNGVEDGNGSIQYKNGNILYGEFKDGHIHGHVVFNYPSGDQREGYFDKNILNGQVIYTKATGETLIETWKDGRRTKNETANINQVKSIRAKTLRRKIDNNVVRRTGGVDFDEEENHPGNNVVGDDHSDDGHTEEEPEGRLNETIQQRSLDKKHRFLFSTNLRRSAVLTNSINRLNGTNKAIQLLRNEVEISRQKFLMSLFNSINPKSNN